MLPRQVAGVSQRVRAPAPAALAPGLARSTRSGPARGAQRRPAAAGPVHAVRAPTAAPDARRASAPRRTARRGRWGRRGPRCPGPRHSRGQQRAQGQRRLVPPADLADQQRAHDATRKAAPATRSWPTPDRRRPAASGSTASGQTWVGPITDRAHATRSPTDVDRSRPLSTRRGSTHRRQGGGGVAQRVGGLKAPGHPGWTSGRQPDDGRLRTSRLQARARAATVAAASGWSMAASSSTAARSPRTRHSTLRPSAVEVQRSEPARRDHGSGDRLDDAEGQRPAASSSTRARSPVSRQWSASATSVAASTDRASRLGHGRRASTGPPRRGSPTGRARRCVVDEPVRAQPAGGRRAGPAAGRRRLASMIARPAGIGQGDASWAGGSGPPIPWPPARPRAPSPGTRSTGERRPTMPPTPAAGRVEGQDHAQHGRVGQRVDQRRAGAAVGTATGSSAAAPGRRRPPTQVAAGRTEWPAPAAWPAAGRSAVDQQHARPGPVDHQVARPSELDRARPARGPSGFERPTARASANGTAERFSISTTSRSVAVAVAAAVAHRVGPVHGVAAGDAHGRLDHRACRRPGAGGPRPRAGQVPPVVGADPPVQRPARRSLAVTQPACVDEAAGRRWPACPAASRRGDGRRARRRPRLRAWRRRPRTRAARGGSARPSRPR